MKKLLVLAVVMMWALPLLAETYFWVDESGTVNFTEEYSRVPVKYRKKVNKRGDVNVRPATPAGKADTSSKEKQPPQQPQAADLKAAPADNAAGLYGGQKAEIWQQNFRVRGAELKRLEEQLVRLEELIKRPVGISRERAFGLPQEFKDTQGHYGEALKRYNELNEAANKAGLPAEFRK
ncbi:MAG: DUF4124 domain-containing protein [Deltaproteobacteria bacterium]|nr:DUF4124 domain-containing protein [Deltaproteobacteria bacterium]